MISVTRKFEASISHRLMAHKGRCANLHGHTYVFEVTVSALLLGKDGLVMDFSMLKEKVGGWIDTYWDHAFIGQIGDPQLEFCSKQGWRCFSMPVGPPTAENMAELLFLTAAQLFVDLPVRVEKVVCWETPSCKAEFRG